MIQLKAFGEGSDQTTYASYDPTLPEVFDEIKRLIHRDCGGAEIEHVGSSSIPGVGGRNAIDVAVVAPASEHESLRKKRQKRGFQPSPFPHYLPLLVAIASVEKRDYSVLLYVVSPQSDVYAGWITFRNYMRTHPDDAAEYGRVKQRVITDGKVQGESYQVAKTPFILSIIEKIARAG